MKKWLGMMKKNQESQRMKGQRMVFANPCFECETHSTPTGYVVAVRIRAWPIECAMVASVLSIPDKSDINSSTPESWKALVVCAIPEPST